MAWHTTIAAVVTLVGTLAYTSHALGQQLGYSLEGEILNINESVTNVTLDPTLANAQTFQIDVIFDTTVAAIPDSDPTFVQLLDSVLSFSFEVYDELGNPIDSPLNVPISKAAAANYAALVEAWTLPDVYDYLLALVARDTDIGLGIVIDPEQLFLTSVQPYPTMVEGSGLSLDAIGYWSNLPESYIQWGLRVTSITALSFSTDSDNDGVDDELDSCTASLLESNVLFNGGFDSGVLNYVDESGCSIMDYYAACTSDSQQETTSFSFYPPRLSGPAYCETQVPYQLIAAGLIDQDEARMLRNALYMSYRSGAR